MPPQLKHTVPLLDYFLILVYNMQSVNNQTRIPLGPNNIFIGTIDDVLGYDSAYYSIYTNQPCEVILYSSNDKQNYTTSTFEYVTPSSSVINSVLLQQRYLYVTIRNTTQYAQIYMNFTMLYKNAGVVTGAVAVTNIPSVQTVSGTVNIKDSNGNTLNSSTGALNVNVQGGNIGVTAISAPTNGGTMWSAASVTNGSTSTAINMSPFNNGVYSIMGNSSLSATYTVQYSPNNTNWFNSTNVITATGDFSLDFQCSASYVRLIASELGVTPSVVSAYLNHA